MRAPPRSPGGEQLFDLETFLRFPHVLVSPENDGLDVADVALATKGVTRRTAVTVSSTPTALCIVTASEPCDQYMSLVMTGRMYADAYRERGLAPENLSRVTEDAGTVTDPLVPWGSGGAYQAATLGVATIAFFPFAFFCWISPLVTILYGYTGWTLKPLAAAKPAEPRPQSAE